jgi:serine protease AprX
MRPTRLSWLPVCLTLSCSLAARDASAQLLSSLVQPLVNTASSLSCSLPLLSTSPRLDAALQKWAREGGSGDRRVIASAEPGLLSVVRSLLGAIGGTPLADLTGINAVVAEVDAAGLSALACSTAVASISLDATVKPTSEADAGAAYSLRATLGLPSDALTGGGIGVAIVDSGVADVADLRGRVTSFYDFTNGTHAAMPSDEYGHGTHVTGLIAAAGASPDAQPTAAWRLPCGSSA